MKLNSVRYEIKDLDRKATQILDRKFDKLLWDKMADLLETVMYHRVKESCLEAVLSQTAMVNHETQQR